MKRKPWGILAALVLTLFLLTTGALAAEHTSHALCPHGAGCTICPEEAKTADAFEGALELTVTGGGLYYGGTKASLNSPAQNAPYVLPAGSYYLGGDLIPNSAILIKGNVNLCLNGYSIEPTLTGKSGHFFELQSGAALNLCDCSTAQRGKILHTMRNESCVGVSGGSFALYSGTLTASDQTYSNLGTQRGVCLLDGRFDMYGGEISGNKAAAGSTLHSGGGVYITGGSFVMHGGRICNNAVVFPYNGSDQGDGGGVYMTDGTFTMDGGTISGNTCTGNGGGVYVFGGTFTMNNGIIGGSTEADANEAVGGGGGVDVGDGTFLMTGGTISHNKANNGAGVSTAYGKFTMTGGTISHNKATYSGGGVSAYSEFTMTGGSITGNTADVAAGGVDFYSGTFCLSGAPFIQGNTARTANNVHLESLKTITLTAALGEGARIGVTPKDLPTDGPVTIAYGESYAITPDDKAKFTSEVDAEYKLVLDEVLNAIVLNPPAAHEHYLCGSDACSDPEHTDCTDKVTFKRWTATDSLPDTAEHWYLAADVTLNGAWTPADGTVLDLNGHSITQTERDAPTISLETGVSFTLTDCNGSQSKHYFKEAANGPWTPSTESEANSILVEGGIISENMWGSAVSLYSASSKFIMYGGTLCGNRNMIDSGGVFMQDGTFAMYGGAILGNYGSLRGGAGVYVGNDTSSETHFSTFTMCGDAVISGNTTEDVNGSGVYVANRAKFTMRGNAQISNNKTIEGNGGGVYVSNGGTFTMDGNAKIADNEATAGIGGNGGGVYVDTSGTFTMGGNATISDNEATAGDGGGVYINTSGTFTMGGSTNSTPSVRNNQAGGSGDGVYVGGTMQISSAAMVMNNDSSDVYLPTGKVIQITGSLIDSSVPTIGITPEQWPAEGSAPVAFAAAASGVTLRDADTKMFFPNGDHSCQTYSVQRDNDSLYLYYGHPHRHPICGETCTHRKADGTYEHPSVTWIGVSELTSEMPEGYYYLTDHVTLTEQWIPKHSLTLCLNGFNVFSTTYTNAITIRDNISITLCDPHGSGKISAPTGDGACVYLEGGKASNNTFATFNMYGGTLTADRYGVYVAQSNSIFNMYGGTITGSKVGVYMKSGMQSTFFNMYGGTITGNGSSDENGGGVYVGSGQFKMSGGLITQNYNTRINGSGGVYVDSGTFEMSGNAVISNNSATVRKGSSIAVPAGAGGVYVEYGTFIMRDNAKITGNTVTINSDANGTGSGGVYVRAQGAMTVSGNVTITGNKDKTGTERDSNVYLTENKVITVADALAGTAGMGVTTAAAPSDAAPVTIATAAGAWIQDGNFTPDDTRFYNMTVSEDGKAAILGMHDHHWGVRAGAQSNVLQEYCTLGCGQTGGTLTLRADNAEYTSSSYDGASLVPDQWHLVATGYPISYEQKVGENSFAAISGAPVNVGDYRASVTVGGVTATKEFSITPRTLAASDFEVTRPSDLTYNGDPKVVEVQPQSAIASAVGTVTVYYTGTDGTNYAKSTAAPTDAGSYEVSIEVTAGVGYAGGSIQNGAAWTFTIAQAEPDLRFEQDTMTITFGQSFENALANPNGLTIMYSSSDEAVAAVDAATGIASINGAGTTTITAASSATRNYKAGSAQYTLTVNKIVLHITGATVSDKVYDGSSAATVTEVTFADAQNAAHTVGYSTVAAFPDANADDANVNVTITVTLADEFTNRYELSEHTYTAAAAAKITAKPIRIEGAAAQNRDYTPNNTAVTITGVTFADGVTLTAGTDYIASGTIGSADAGTKDVTVTVTLMGDAANNYSLSSSQVNTTVVISQIAPALPSGLTGWQGNKLSTVSLGEAGRMAMS